MCINGYDMLSQERQDIIRARLAEKGRVVAVDLAKEFGVSEDAIRRDLRELARLGLCRKVYGGALPPAPDLGTIGFRENDMVESKRGLALAVSELIKEGQTILIDASSTNLMVARSLPHDRAFTVVTNAPALAVALSDHRSCTTILLGGLFNPEKGACVGGDTIREARKVYADAFILGACGLDPDAGITALDPQEAEVKRVFIEQSSRLIVPLTTDKVGTAAPFKIAEAAAIDELIVERGLDAEAVERYRRLGINVLRSS